MDDSTRWPINRTTRAAELKLWFCGLLLTVCSINAYPATFTVDSLADNSDDNAGDGECESLVGSLGNFQLVCTLRGAIEEANALAGDDIVEFSVAGTLRLATPLPPVTERLTIRGHSAPGAPSFSNSEPQPPVIVINGEFLADDSIGLDFQSGAELSLASNLSVVNMGMSGIEVSAAGVWLSGNWIGLFPDNSIGANGRGVRAFSVESLTMGQGLIGGSGNVVSGNAGDGVSATANNSEFGGNYIGVDGVAAIARPNGQVGFRLLGDDNEVGAVSSDTGNIFAGNTDRNLTVQGDRNLIENNRIGVGLDPDTPIINGGIGASVGGSENQVGSLGRGNLIGDNGSAGLVVGGPPDSSIGNVVEGNQLVRNEGQGLVIAGTAETRVSHNDITENEGAGLVVEQGGIDFIIEDNNILDNVRAGISLTNASGGLIRANDIGGNLTDGISVSAGENQIIENRIGQIQNEVGELVEYGNFRFGIFTNRGVDNNVANNVIAFNGGAGIAAVVSPQLAAMVNQFFANGGLGIDLGMDGVTPNDLDDTDAGPNNLQNYPLIELVEFAIDNPPVVRLDASVDTSLAAGEYPVRIDFYQADPATPDQGRDWLSMVSVSAPNAVATLDLPLPNGTTGGYLVALATDARGNTSEFSPTIIFGVPGSPAEIFSDGFESSL